MSLINTLVAPLRAQYGGYDKNELRASRYAAWDLFLSDKNSSDSFLNSDTQNKIESQFALDVQIPVIDFDGTVSINSGSRPPLVIADDENTSQIITATSVDYWFGFTMYPAQYADGQNSIGYQADFNRKMKKYLLEIAGLFDTQCISVLDTNKSQVIANPIDYAVSGDTLNATLAQKLKIFADLEPIMNSNDYYAEAMKVIGNTGVQALVKEIGLNRDNDKGEYVTGLDFSYSNRVTNAANKLGTGYAVQPGNFAALWQNAPDNRAKSRIGGGQIEWDIMKSAPIIGVDLDTYYYENAADASALNASTAWATQTKVEGFIFGTRLFLLSAYNSDIANIASPVLKFDVATT